MTRYKHDVKKDDAEFQSLRYVLGEMPLEEAQAFEETLANDQEARELVARSTGLVIDLLAHPAAQAGDAGASEESPTLGRPLSVQSKGAGRRFGAWGVAGLAAAACCCVAIGLFVTLSGGRTPLNDIYSSDLSEIGADHLVAIWSQRLAEWAPETATTEPGLSERSDMPLPGENDESRLATTANAPADSATVGDQIASDDSDVPGWMVAAVELGQSHAPKSSHPEVLEN